MESEKNDYYLEHKTERIGYQKKYNRENSDKIKEYQRNYYKKTREEKLDKQKIYNNKKSECICGKIITQSNKSSHLKSKKHLKIMEEKEKNNGGEGVSP